MQCIDTGTTVRIRGSNKPTSSLALEEHVKGNAACLVAGGSHAPGDGKKQEAGQRCFELRHVLYTQWLLAFLPVKEMEQKPFGMETVCFGQEREIASVTTSTQC